MDTNVIQRPDISSTLQVRDVEPILSLVISRFPITKLLTIDSDRPAINHIHEWFDDQIVQQTTTVTSDISPHSAHATGISIGVLDSSIFLVNDQVIIDQFEPTYQVTSITNPTTIVVKEVRGVHLTGAAGANHIARYNRAQLEVTDFGTFNGARLGQRVLNFTQIWRYNTMISWHQGESAARGGVYTEKDLWANAINRGTEKIAWEMYEAVTKGVGQERTANNVPGFMGGIREFIDVPGGNVIVSSGAVSLAKINKVFRLIFDDMNDLTNLVVCVPPGISQRIARLDPNAIRYNDPNANRMLGTNVATLVPDIGGSQAVPILIDPNMPTNQIWFLDRTRLQLVPFSGFPLRFFEQPTQGTTARQGFLYGEYTLVVRNGKVAHGILKNVN